MKKQPASSVVTAEQPRGAGAVDDSEVMFAPDIARLFGLSVATVRADVSRRPETLPPPFRPPGTRKVRWLRSEVLAWMRDQQVQRRKK